MQDPVKSAIFFTSIFPTILASVLGFSAINAMAGGNQKITFEDTKTGQPLKISSELFNTEQAKKFASTGQNPYIGNKNAIAEGKKLYHLYSCNQCHGSNAQGQTAYGITGPKYNHAKSANDKGMFEIIWAGTNGGMSGKGKGMMDPNDPKAGLSPDEALKVIAWIRSQGDGGQGGGTPRY